MENRDYEQIVIFCIGGRPLTVGGLSSGICVLTDHLEKQVSSEITRSDDSKKNFRVGRTKAETKVLQKDIRKQHEWA